jgi:hypothetical protein
MTAVTPRRDCCHDVDEEVRSSAFRGSIDSSLCPTEISSIGVADTD